jgi:hypothetical protein
MFWSPKVGSHAGDETSKVERSEAFERFHDRADLSLYLIPSQNVFLGKECPTTPE